MMGTESDNGTTSERPSFSKFLKRIKQATSSHENLRFVSQQDSNDPGMLGNFLCMHPPRTSTFSLSFPPSIAAPIPPPFAFFSTLQSAGTWGRWDPPWGISRNGKICHGKRWRKPCSPSPGV